MMSKQIGYLFLIVILLTTACSKDDVNDSRLLEGTPPVVSGITITTNSVTNITTNSAVSGGNIIVSGNDSILARGVCWSTSANPTILDSHSTDGNGAGSFTSSMTALSSSTTYYVRAYATDQTGTFYGDQKNFTTSSVLTIGSSYQGGIIFYLDSTGSHGMVCAPVDQADSADWGCPSFAISGADATSVGSGKQNTIEILASCPTATAARICDTLTLNGYNDWFLPSKGELQLMYTNLHVTGLANFTGLAYWSSSEMTSTFAWQIIFSGGIVQGSTKNNMISIRAVREF